MNLVEKKSNCTGCGACSVLCPSSAIKMREDEKGFLYPEIMNKYCTNCGICKRNCPNLAERNNQNENIEIYAMKNKEENIRKSSSSGGVFYEYAKSILDENGVVYGAAYNQFNEVEHIRVDSKENIYKLQGSKYTQSTIINTYEQVKKDLQNGKKVLFSGTPCQIAGIKAYIAKKRIDTENFYTCDIICHGVPSPKIFKEYLKELENKYKSKIKKINFRHKEHQNTQITRIEFENGEYYQSDIYSRNNQYWNLFIGNYILRESCYECKYANLNRLGDITLGDFWGIEKSIQNFDDNKGVSLVLINSEKGKEIFKKIKDKFDIEKSCKENCLQNNLIKPSEKNNNYDKFWEEYLKFGYEKAREVL